MRNKFLKFQVAICLIAFSISGVAFAVTKISDDQFFNELTNTLIFTHAKLAGNWNVNINDLYTQIKNPSAHQKISIDDAYLKNASGVQDPQKIWQFTNNELNNKVIQLFQTIATNQKQLGFNVDLTKYDLFHGHLFALHNADNTVSDIGILFHAKEYPRDLKLGNPDAEKNSPFTTSSPGYGYRNFIWLASTKTIYNLDSYSHEIFPAFFLPDGIDSGDPSMQEVIKQYLKARTFIIDNLTVEILGDVNCFIIDNNPVIFFTYQSI